jgi:hypothetical protein
MNVATCDVINISAVHGARGLKPSRARATAAETSPAVLSARELRDVNFYGDWISFLNFGF